MEDNNEGVKVSHLNNHYMEATVTILPYPWTGDTII